MKVIIDSAIPYVGTTLAPYAEVVRIAGREITPESVRDADALVVRTRTRVDAKLLEGSSVEFVATATIGRDHIDEAYCHSRGIEICSAPGCNARGVLQWVAAVLRHISRVDGKRPEDYTLGVVGVGNVGSLVSHYARLWGFRVMKCDPPRQLREGGEYYTIEEIARRSDIITLHTPLDSTTHHYVDATLIETMRPETTIINASRGGVVDNRAVAQSAHRYIFDVWEDEPDIPIDILSGATLATAHIAGYTTQGKANATAMSIRSLARHFGLPLTDWYPAGLRPTLPRDISWEELCTTIDRYIDIEALTVYLKCHPSDFEAIRNNPTSLREEYF